MKVIAGIKILGSRVCYRGRPVGRTPHCCRLSTEEEEQRKSSTSTEEYVAEDPADDSMKLTSANVLDWWMLFDSQTSCSFCLSWDRVSCTVFREVSTEEGNVDAYSFQIFPLA